MPLERHIDDLTACDGIKFWMSVGEPFSRRGPRA